MKQINIFRVEWLFALFLAFTLAVVPGQAQQSVLTESFDDPTLPGWEHSPGVTVEDGTLHIEPNNFAAHGSQWGDFVLSVRVKRSGEGALVVSYRLGDQGAYHLLLEGEQLVLQREAGGAVNELEAAPSSILPDQWHQIDVTVTGSEHTVTLNGETVLTATDPNPLPPGGIAFETLGQATGVFDDLTVTVSGDVSPPVETASGAETVPPAAPPVASAGTPAYQATPWVYTGGPIGGLGYDVRMRPDNPDIMFVTDAWAGVFKSVDGGANWFPSNSGITTRVGPSGDGIPVFSLTIDPNNHDRIWIGTQFSNSVFRSDDGGSTWQPMNNGIMEIAPTIRGFTVEPGNSDVVYLAGEVSSWEWNGEPLPGLGLDMTKGIVYKSVDGGQNWQRIWFGDNLARYIWIHPQNHDLIYVSTGIFDREAANSNPDTLEPGGVGILRSRDGGETWEVLNEANGFNSD